MGKKKSVLVIGWEFPPRMVGGLAVATYGIVKALSNLIHVKLIIPYKDDETPKIKNVTVYGLNKIKDEIGSIEISQLMDKMFKHEWSQQLSAYPLQNIQSSSSFAHLESNSNEKIFLEHNYLSLFESEQVYGIGLREKMKAFKEIVAVMSKHISFDLIHCHDWVTFETGMLIKYLTNKPLAVHVHALETDRAGINTRNDIFHIEKNAMEMADVVFPVSEYTKQSIIKNYGITEDKIVPVHNAVDYVSTKRWRHLLPQKIVTFLGRITPQKGPIFLLETIQKVVNVHKDVIFIIAGSGDQLEEILMQSAYKRLSRYMIFTGFIKRDKVNALLSTSDIYFMPSVSEPFGLTALEAAKAGVACVISKQSGVSEVLPSSLKADFWDTDKFAAQIIDLLQDGEKRAHIASKQMQEAEKVNWMTSAERVAAAYDEILK
ncbi:glycosyltransferase [Flagellimonas sp. 2504JD4-2]